MVMRVGALLPILEFDSENQCFVISCGWIILSRLIVNELRKCALNNVDSSGWSRALCYVSSHSLRLRGAFLPQVVLEERCLGRLNEFESSRTASWI